MKLPFYFMFQKQNIVEGPVFDTRESLVKNKNLSKDASETIHNEMKPI